MKGLVFLGDRRAEVRDFPEETPGQGEVLLRMRASGMCGSDLHKYRGPAAETSFPDNRIGHEPCGEVVALGPGVTRVRVGARVMQHHYLGCGRCRYCQMGYQQLCSDTKFKKGYYGGSLHGGHGDYMVCNERTCVALSDELSFDVGAMLACGSSTAYLALTKLQVSGRDTVAVFGQGPVGLAATMLGMAMGARIIAVDPSEKRLALARTAGAWKAVNPNDGDSVEQIKSLTRGEGADATIEAVGIPLTRKQAATSARIFGRCALVGERGQAVYEATPDIIHRHLTIYGSWTVSTFGMEEVARFVVDRGVPLQDLITERVQIKDGVEAYRRFDKQDTGKMVIVWG
ncbi:MAG: zinc-binding dehydrogenase [Chloroflexi bacterium]|nr:zinc-binding dehydrogenase [Chloroflexota bacterium]